MQANRLEVVGISLARDGEWSPDPGAPCSWAQAKCEHAIALGLRLQDRLHEWASLPDDIYELVLSDDRLHFEIRLSDEFPRPPLPGWSLLLGDVIHNLRAALDALVWAHVKPDALTRKQQQAIYFPLCLTPEAWERARPTALRTVPDEIANRIREDQPFHLEEPEQCVLLLLHRLDIQDKHREMVRTRAAAVRFEHELRLDTWRALPSGTKGQSEIVSADLEPGALLVRGSSPVPIRRVHGRLRLELDFGFAEDLLIAESIIELLAGLTNNVRAIVHNVEGTLDQLLTELDRS